MMIVLEGPDGAGKTTLARLLAEVGGLTYVHHGPPTGPPFNAYQAALHQENVVIDRLFHGELVYGPALRGASQLDDIQVQYLELEAQKAGAVVVWCVCDPKVLLRRRLAFYQKHDAWDLSGRYQHVMGFSQLPRVLYDSSSEEPEEVARSVLILASHYLTTRYRGVGNPNAEVALVGERLSGQLPPPGDAAWTNGSVFTHMRPFDRSRSGRYLMECLWRWPSYHPSRFYLTNAYKDHLEEDDGEELVAELARIPQTVALGEQAAERLREVGRDPVVVPHPQYWSRFHHHDRSGYAQRLQEAMKLA